MLFCMYSYLFTESMQLFCLSVLCQGVTCRNILTHMQATSVLGGVCLCVLAVSMLLCLYSHPYTEVFSYSTFITPAGIRMAAVFYTSLAIALLQLQLC